MKSISRLALALLAFALTTTMSFAEDKPATTAVPEYLFVQTAKGGTFKGKKLTLTDVSEQTLFFTDRPNRIAGHISTRHFIENWATGTDSFKSDPPNATLSVLGGEGMTNIVVEVMNPKLKGNSVTYKVKILEGTPPTSFGAASLFFDLIMTGGGPGATSQPYTFSLENKHYD